MSKKVEIELKYKITDVVGLLSRIDGPKQETLYIKDEIYGSDKVDWKIRKRTIFNWYQTREEYEKTTPLKSKKVKKVLEEKVEKIPKGFKCENSYDKIRFYFKRNSYEIAVDFYSVGVFCEIEGPERLIRQVARKLNLSNNIKENVDTFYREYCQKEKIEEKDHWGFSSN